MIRIIIFLAVFCTAVSAIGNGGLIDVMNPPAGSGLTAARGDCSTDDGPAIQAASDYAFAHGMHGIFLPSTIGCYRYTPPLYMDPPGNLRSSLTQPPMGGFSMGWYGVGFPGDDPYHTTTLEPINDTVPALWIGTGSGLTLSGIAIHGPGHPASQLGYNVNGIGIAIAGGDGGSTNALIENIHITNFFTGVKTGANRDGLADNITCRKCWIERVYRGWWVGSTQNFIQDLDEVTLIANQAIYNPRDIHVNVRGGNLGSLDAALAVLPISNVSVLTDTGDGSYSFTVNTTATDPLLSIHTVMPDSEGTLWAYHRCALKTANFDLVPVLFKGYAAPTISLRILDSWRNAHFGLNNLSTTTDLISELQAATLLYCSEEQTIYTGAVNVHGAHVETPRPHTLLDMQSTQTGGNQQQSVLDRLRYNNDPSGSDLFSYVGTGNSQEAAYYIQQSHPWMSLSSPTVSVRDSNFLVSHDYDAPIIDGSPGNAYSEMYFFERNVNLWFPNLRYWGNPATSAGQQNDDPSNPGNIVSRYRGFGSWGPFSPFNQSSCCNYANDGIYPSSGYRPSPWALPRISPLMFGRLSANSLPPFGQYPPIEGSTLYQVISSDPTKPVMLVRSAHHFGSYGQALSGIGWSYKGGSNVIKVTNATPFLFAGLYIGLNLPGYGTVWFVVTGGSKQRGIITVAGVGNGSSIPSNPGDIHTVYSGTGILQEPFNWKSVTLQ